MKRLLLATTALLAIAAATPASAETFTAIDYTV